MNATEKKCPDCGTRWTAPIEACPACDEGFVAVPESGEPRGSGAARRQLDLLSRNHGREPRLGCELNAHRDLGFCAFCRVPFADDSEGLRRELEGWRLLAIAERGVAPQPGAGARRCSSCGQPLDSPPCARNPETGQGSHTTAGGCAAAGNL